MTLDSDPASRRARARVSLDGLSVGDAFGERFFVHPDSVDGLIEARAVPRAPWPTTDDTEMAIAVVEVLARRGAMDPDALADAFAARYARDPARGYGPGAHRILGALVAGESWRDTAGVAFAGGSMGNGAAMRSPPLGAYFADDMEAVVVNARASAVVTHAHPDGIAGAIAAAIAAAQAFCARGREIARARREIWEATLAHTPQGATRDGVLRASQLSLDAPISEAAALLGSGQVVLAQDTVPFALWCALRHLDSYEECLWSTVAGLGDRDTTCAIAGGIVVGFTGVESIPAEWLASRERLRAG